MSNSYAREFVVIIIMFHFCKHLALPPIAFCPYPIAGIATLRGDVPLSTSEDCTALAEAYYNCLGDQFTLCMFGNTRVRLPTCTNFESGQYCGFFGHCGHSSIYASKRTEICKPARESAKACLKCSSFCGDVIDHNEFETE